MNVHPLTNAWIENEVTWINRTAPTPWTTAGGDCGEILLGIPFVSGIHDGTWLSFSIPTATVQSWIDAPSSNDGLLIRPAADGDPGDPGVGSNNYNTAHFVSSEDPDTGLRPRLVLNVTAAGNIPPLVSVVAPTEETILAAGQDLQISADAWDPDGTVARIEFYVDGSLVGQSTGPVYSCTLPAVNGGTRSIVAKAYDNTGAYGVSTPVSVWVPWVAYSADMSADPGWTLTGQWAWGQPGGSPDPVTGVVSLNVIGYKLSGAYENIAATEYATTPAINCTGYTNLHLEFARWLGVEMGYWDTASIEVSANGVDWITIWSNPPAQAIVDTAWRLQKLDISSIADNQPTLYIRWGIGPALSAWTYSGWNLDCVRVGGIRTTSPPDSNGDGLPDEWLIHYFGSTNAPNSGPAEDKDGDGASNLDEYLAGTDPLDATDFLKVTVQFAGNQPEVNCPMKPIGPFQTGYSRFYSLETSSNLVAQDWTGIPSCTNIPASTGAVSFTSTASATSSFFRASIKVR